MGYKLHKVQGAVKKISVTATHLSYMPDWQAISCGCYKLKDLWIYNIHFASACFNNG